MPVRSSSSRVLKWPDAQTVREAVVRWAQQIAQQRPEVARIGLFGSYARGDWGVGSDIDLVVIVHHTDMPFIRRALDYDTRGTCPSARTCWCTRKTSGSECFKKEGSLLR
jgi:predicted nucleotidyltransferase